MQIVIDIDENVFTRLFDNGIEDYAIVNDDLFAIAKSIRKCTPLPKGHGRLIDADEIQFENNEFDTYSDYSRAFDAIDGAETIIGAGRMTRLEENGMVVDEMNKRAELKPTGSYEEMVTFQLGTIATMLADISKSLAILADKAERDALIHFTHTTR